MAAHGLDQVDGLRNVIDLHLTPFDLWRVDGVGDVTVEQFPADTLLEGLFEHAVHVLDGLRRQRSLGGSAVRQCLCVGFRDLGGLQPSEDRSAE